MFLDNINSRLYIETMRDYLQNNTNGFYEKLHTVHTKQHKTMVLSY